MSVKVDAKGLACPMPVIKTKKALESIVEGTVEVVVDNNVPKENILKFAKSINCKAEVLKNKEGEIVISIEKVKNNKVSIPDEDITCDTFDNNIGDEVIAIMSDKMGNGNDELGRVLIKGFLFALTESNPLPKAILFLNGGVELTTKNEATVEHVKKLEELGVEILSCGTCLDYYGLKEELKVGSITNMYTIVENMKSSSKLITIG
ncbi:sulfurtransferase-like selenium metabolism protein YedF [Peptostreptococcus canis]|uniref:Sulfurtransferase-like selenium metabolism protein YedF n=1 Tax=Peptostreptococcus canis TaxID=1159213 RepID=A0ABR6TMN2_9FIRM|nr:sulfurtransferase-like selenium metabolism protein YedF [Peptostreptococcus canis]MBC2576672.1 sulfurtransferase-like selenium metabolism protein YedF [Peptostreptococcus canis]MBP1998578.1 selenium metabolism protein YedF [Peptostreptococcus canis]